MKYILFEKSAVELIINNGELQSLDYTLGKEFIRCLRSDTKEISINNLIIKEEKEGLIFCGKNVEKTILLFDLEKCRILEKANDAELLMILQKTFRFAVRFWNQQMFTNCEKIFKDHAVIFPFPFSAGSAYRIVVARNLSEKRLDARGITKSLLAYKYGQEGPSSSIEDIPDLSILRKGGEQFLESLSDLKKKIQEQNKKIATEDSSEQAIRVISSDSLVSTSEFKYMNYEKQLKKLTLAQQRIVECEDLKVPIRIEGPAGTGKTAALILRAIKMLRDAEKKGQHMSMAFFTHSKSTQTAVKHTFVGLAKNGCLDSKNIQNIQITTLQEYCMGYIGLENTQVIDLDASEAKQYQLLLIQDALEKLKGTVFNTYKPIMSKETVTFFEGEEENKIVLMLQHEFSIRIKGMAEGDFERYKKVNSLKNGLPLKKDADKEFVFRIFNEYQQALESQSVYDTDDIILEALARLNAPLWRRARIREGLDYLFVDEMHLFNLNEQQIFHFLTKDEDQKGIPISFALDYGQAIGERGDINENFIETSITKDNTVKEELSTVFRSSPQISELCASITASGALLFDSFVNPYKFSSSGFTAGEEALCEVPKLIMYENDYAMKQSLEGHIKTLTNKYKCQPCDIALIFFDEQMLHHEFTKYIGRYSVNYINGRESCGCDTNKTQVVCSLPEYINGLEFKCVVLVGVDEGRVPPNGIQDVSSNFLKYSSLNKLYLSCSRAKYNVLILGNKVRGVSSCLLHSLQNKTLMLEE